MPRLPLSPSTDGMETENSARSLPQDEMGAESHSARAINEAVSSLAAALSSMLQAVEQRFAARLSPVQESARETTNQLARLTQAMQSLQQAWQTEGARLRGETERLRNELAAALRQREELDQRLQHALKQGRGQRTSTGGTTAPQHDQIVNAYRTLKTQQLHEAALAVQRGLGSDCNGNGDLELAAIKAALGHSFMAEEVGSSFPSSLDNLFLILRERLTNRAVVELPADIDWKGLFSTAAWIVQQARLAEPPGRFFWDEEPGVFDPARHEWAEGGPDLPGTAIAFCIVPGYEVSGRGVLEKAEVVTKGDFQTPNTPSEPGVNENPDELPSPT